MHYKIYPIDACTENEKGGLRLSTLNFACENNNFEAVKLLIKYGANVNGGAGGYKPILFSAIKSGNMELFDLLVQSGANANVKDTYNRKCS